MEENYRKEVKGIKQIALEQYDRCLILGSKNILTDKEAREVYVNAIKIMEIVVLPELLKSKFEELKTGFEENEKQIIDLEKEYNQKLTSIKKKANGKPFRHDRLTEDFERKLIVLMNNKLLNISLLLKAKNYYDEEIYIDQWLKWVLGANT